VVIVPSPFISAAYKPYASSKGNSSEAPPMTGEATVQSVKLKKYWRTASRYEKGKDFKYCGNQEVIQSRS
jgi:hypothetical protein